MLKGKSSAREVVTYGVPLSGEPAAEEHGHAKHWKQFQPLKLLTAA